MRITILGINFEPEVTGIGPYTTQLADHLALRHHVTVITGTAHYPDWKNSGGFRGYRHYGVSTSGVHVIRHSHYVPSSQSALRRGAYEASWLLNAARKALVTPTDVVIAVVPALLTGLLSRVVARLHGAASGVIVQDVMSAALSQSGVGGGKVIERLTRAIEGGALRASTGVVTIHPQLAEFLQGAFGLEAAPGVIYNWAHIAPTSPGDRVATRARLGWGNDFVALHSGNMGLKQDLGNILAAGSLAAKQARQVRFVIAGGGSQYLSLRSAARTHSNVSVVPGVSDEEFSNFLGAADVLLLNERPGMDSMSLPSKLTSYFTAGRPIVAATDAGSATAAFVREARAALTVPAGEPGALLDAVWRLKASPDLADQLGRNGLQFAQTRLTRDSALRQYEQWVEQIARTKRQTQESQKRTGIGPTSGQ